MRRSRLFVVEFVVVTWRTTPFTRHVYVNVSASVSASLAFTLAIMTVRFVGVVVQVRWRGEAGRYPVIEDAQLAVALVAADLGDGQGAEEPVWLSLVGCDGKAVLGAKWDPVKELSARA